MIVGKRALFTATMVRANGPSSPCGHAHAQLFVRSCGRQCARVAGRAACECTRTVHTHASA
eukprot:2231707-Pleurochrysis_carterae.AAC.1